MYAMTASTALLPSAARTVSVTQPLQKNLNNRGIKVFIKCTASSSGSFKVGIYWGDYYGNKTLALESANIVSAGSATLTIFPSATASTNVVANDQVPSWYSVDVTHNNSNSITYSVSYDLLP